MNQQEHTTVDQKKSSLQKALKSFISVVGPCAALICCFFLGSLYHQATQPKPKPQKLQFVGGSKMTLTTIRVGKQSFAYFSKRKPTSQELEQLKQGFIKNPLGKSKHKTIVNRRITVNQTQTK